MIAKLSTLALLVTIPGVREQVYSSVTASSQKTHTDLYGLVDIFPFAGGHSKESAFPHVNTGIPGRRQATLLWDSRNAHDLDQARKIGFPLRIGRFAGIAHEAADCDSRYERNESEIER